VGGIIFFFCRLELYDHQRSLGGYAGKIGVTVRASGSHAGDGSSMSGIIAAGNNRERIFRCQGSVNICLGVYHAIGKQGRGGTGSPGIIFRLDSLIPQKHDAAAAVTAAEGGMGIINAAVNDTDKVTIIFLYKEEKLEQQITYKEYEEACEELLMKIREPVKKSLADAGLKLSDIDEVLLIGGATRLNIVRDFLIRLFRKFPDTKMNPDETVALGAAVQAAMKERREEVKEVILTDVCSFTLGTEVVVEYDEGKYEDGRFCPIIERNTVIPASHTERLYTARDNQTKVRVRVLQGESRFARNNLFLGEMEIEIPKAPKGQESVDVTYTYDINSLLEVEVTVVSTGESRKMIIKGQENEMTEEEIKKRMEELAYLKIQPRDYEENRLVLTRAERMYEETLGERRRVLDRYITAFEAALKDGDHDAIREAREELNEVLEEDDEE